MFFLFLSATFNEVAHIAFFFLFNEEGIIFVSRIISSVFAEINVFDACSFVIGLLFGFNVFEAHKLNIAGFSIFHSLDFTGLGLRLLGHAGEISL